MSTRFQQIAEEWFLTEPLLFSVYCSHTIREMQHPEKMQGVVLRSGQGKIEYNPVEIAQIDDKALKEFLRLEVIRILLKHPYQRQPKPVHKDVCCWSSDLVLQDHYQPKVRLFHRDDFPHTVFPGYKAAFEEYYKILVPLLQGDQGENSESNRNSEQQNEKAASCAELWQEDTLVQEEINRFIETAEQSQSWGSLKGKMREQILASTQTPLDCSRILNGFRGSILSSKRMLTRMRPSRRYGFDNMGSRHQFSTRLLVAVDVSGSVSSDTLKQFFGIVNRFFKYGMDKVEVLQFDTEIKGEPVTLKRARKEIEIHGRGGTSYQRLFDFVCNDGAYDGVIICTDGFAPAPYLKRHIPTQILWLFSEKAFYERHTWARALPNSRAAFLQ